MTTYIHDGVVFDLDCGFVDVVGIEWRWSGGYSPAGEPLLVGGVGQSTGVPLPDVYRDHGPLIPLPAALTARLRKAVVSADYQASVAAGHVETYEQYALRTARAGS
ncbi:phiSA1p31-related protein [Streptomyces lavendulocolor]|uniref:phiSA1p31-related protein n=1 Tax=Streptomyces lavendulocolor TaxID=67316 RepID=UPI003400977F